MAIASIHLKEKCLKLVQVPFGYDHSLLSIVMICIFWVTNVEHKSVFKFNKWCDHGPRDDEIYKHREEAFEISIQAMNQSFKIWLMIFVKSKSSSFFMDSWLVQNLKLLPSSLL